MVWYIYKTNNRYSLVSLRLSCSHMHVLVMRGGAVITNCSVCHIGGQFHSSWQHCFTAHGNTIYYTQLHKCTKKTFFAYLHKGSSISPSPEPIRVEKKAAHDVWDMASYSLSLSILARHFRICAACTFAAFRHRSRVTDGLIPK